MRKIGLVHFALAAAGICSGCATGSSLFDRHDRYSHHEPGSDAWWAEKAALPPGVRQQLKKGKLWPPNPRSTEEPQKYCHTFHSEHYWPLPYVCQDRAHVQQGLEHQISLGWQEATTLYDRHFDPTTQGLTRAGNLQLSYFVHGVPVERRAVHIQSTHNAETDAARTDSVTSAISAISGGEVSVPVILRDCQQYGRPAAEVDQINKLYNGTTPVPRLGSSDSSGGSSSTTATN